MRYFLLFLLLLRATVFSANWLYIQGTEKDNNITIPKLWGFVQAGYQQDFGTKLISADGTNKTPFVMLPPDLSSQAAFEIARARLAVRGKIDKANTLNYFFMTEFAPNGITKPAGHPSHTYLTDASMTYRAIPYMNIRVGQFKYPGSEEGMRAVFESPYRNFTTVGNMLLLERFIPNNATQTSGFYQAAPQNSVGAYRDRGVELFAKKEIFQNNEISYALMIGNGSGISSKEGDFSPTYYLYLANEQLFGKGHGFYAESFKTYLWYQNGSRLLNNHSYSRERSGLGVSYYKSGLRLGAELIEARGMIFNGAKDSSGNIYDENWEYQIAADKNNKAYGGYINAQYFITEKLELLSRYDYLNRLYNSEKNNRVFQTLTIGTSYHFKRSTRIDFNYAFRDLNAPHNNAAQEVVSNTGNLLSIQATLKF